MAPKRKREIPSLPPTPVAVPLKIQYVSESDISDLLFCTICQDVFTDPMRISCGHTFCKGCLDQWINSYQGNRRDCPTCRQTFHQQATHKDLLAVEFLGREQVFCPHTSCTWTGRYDQVRNHMQTCEFNPVNIPAIAQVDGTVSSLRMRMAQTAHGRALLERHQKAGHEVFEI